MQSFVPSLVVLGFIALLAFLQSGRSTITSKQSLRRASIALAVATLVQSIHFAEEALTGFHVRFAALFGLEPIPISLFFAFNVFWITAWLYAVFRIRSKSRFSLFAAWFLCLAGMLNGVAHPALAIYVDGYFPGLATSPLIFAACLLLFVQLRRRNDSGTSTAV